MFLKMMGAGPAPDNDSRQVFTLLDEVTVAQFGRLLNDKEAEKPEHRLVADHGPYVDVTFRDGSTERYYPEGNCYLMNDTGKTIASFGVHPYVPTRERD